MLDDEEHLVVVLRVADRLLRREQLIQPQVRAVGHPPRQVGDDPVLQRPLVAGGIGGAGRVSRVSAHDS